MLERCSAKYCWPFTVSFYTVLCIWSQNICSLIILIMLIMLIKRFLSIMLVRSSGNEMYDYVLQTSGWTQKRQCLQTYACWLRHLRIPIFTKILNVLDLTFNFMVKYSNWRHWQMHNAFEPSGLEAWRPRQIRSERTIPIATMSRGVAESRRITFRQDMSRGVLVYNRIFKRIATRCILAYYIRRSVSVYVCICICVCEYVCVRLNASVVR